MDTRKIIIIEEGNLIIKRLNQCLPKSHFSLTQISNLNDVNSILTEVKPKIVIVDPYSFASYGFKLIEIFLNQEASPIVVVMSEKRDAETIIRLIKSGVYDYIIMDRDEYEIEHKIKHACDAAELHSLKKIHDKELRILNGYYSIHKSGNSSKHHNRDVTLISNIRKNFSQGSGIGTIVSLISMIEKKATKKNDMYLVDEKIISTLMDNSKEVQRLIEAFENLERYSNENLELEDYSIDMVYDIVNNQINKISDIAAGFKKTIRLNERDYFGGQYINWIGSYAKIIVNELLFNAIKFSPRDSEILVFLQKVDHGLLLSVLNQPELNATGIRGIPEEYQGLIFEPFFRLSKHVYDKIPTLDYGLGLTLINLLVKKLNGSIKVSNLESYVSLDKKPQQLISMEIWLPTYDKPLTELSDQSKEKNIPKPAISKKVKV